MKWEGGREVATGVGASQRGFPLEALQRDPQFLLLQVLTPLFILIWFCTNYVKCVVFIFFSGKIIIIKTMGSGCW